MVRHSCLIPEEEITAVKMHIEALAHNIAYGGSIDVKIHAPLFEAKVPEYTAVIHAKWAIGRSLVPAENPWDLKIKNAMVDRKRGFVSFDEPTISHGRSPFRRAMKSNNTATVVSQDQNDDGSKYTVLRYSKWGSHT